MPPDGDMRRVSCINITKYPFPDRMWDCLRCQSKNSTNFNWHSLASNYARISGYWDLLYSRSIFKSHFILHRHCNIFEVIIIMNLLERGANNRGEWDLSMNWRMRSTPVNILNITHSALIGLFSKDTGESCRSSWLAI